MRGDWDDLARRLTSAILSLDVYDAVVVGDRQPPRKRSFLGLGAVPPAPARRYVQVTAAQSVLIGECVGARSWGGEWDISPATQQELLDAGWEKPWSTDSTTYWRESSLQQAARMARSLVRALRILGCEMEGLEVSRIREEPEA